MSLDLEKYPDGISIPMDVDGMDGITRGYYLITEDGTWYEIYLSEEINMDSLEEEMEAFNSLYIDIEERQVSFLEIDSSDYNLDEFLDIIC